MKLIVKLGLVAVSASLPLVVQTEQAGGPWEPVNTGLSTVSWSSDLSYNHTAGLLATGTNNTASLVTTTMNNMPPLHLQHPRYFETTLSTRLRKAKGVGGDTVDYIEVYPETISSPHVARNVDAQAKHKPNKPLPAVGVTTVVGTIGSGCKGWRQFKNGLWTSKPRGPNQGGKDYGEGKADDICPGNPLKHLGGLTWSEIPITRVFRTTVKVSATATPTNATPIQAITTKAAQPARVDDRPAATTRRRLDEPRASPHNNLHMNELLDALDTTGPADEDRDQAAMSKLIAAFPTGRLPGGRWHGPAASLMNELTYTPPLFTEYLSKWAKAHETDLYY